MRIRLRMLIIFSLEATAARVRKDKMVGGSDRFSGIKGLAEDDLSITPMLSMAMKIVTHQD
jgi:hypothetical protein